jgi:hypothetical protein
VVNHSSVHCAEMRGYASSTTCTTQPECIVAAAARFRSLSPTNTYNELHNSCLHVLTAQVAAEYTNVTNNIHTFKRFSQPAHAGCVVGQHSRCSCTQPKQHKPAREFDSSAAVPTVGWAAPFRTVLMNPTSAALCTMHQDCLQANTTGMGQGNCIGHSHSPHATMMQAQTSILL